MKHLLITGANKGIGKALVKAALEWSDEICVHLGSRDASRGQHAVDDLLAETPSFKERLFLLLIDVSDEDSVASAAEKRVRREEPLAAIINNAGIGLSDDALERVLDVNVRGIEKVCRHFMPQLSNEGRIVNQTSAAGPNFVARCSPDKQAFFLSADASWKELDSFMRECEDIAGNEDAFAERGLADGQSYGLSKACANKLTLMLADEHPELQINACTPGFIETDLTRGYAEAQGKSPKDMGMKEPAKGTKSALFLALGETQATGHYFGSDAKRSPLDRYRAPGDPEYQGD